MTGYSVLLPVYEGPLDLLLQLIERAELDITSVALASVTDQYLAHLQQIEERDMADLAAFLVIAARLLQIKSEALLPRPPEPEVGEEPPGESLARQLLVYKRYRDAAAYLGTREESNLRTYPRIAGQEAPPPKPDLTGLAPADLRSALLQVLAAKSVQHDEVLTMPRIRLREKIAQIIELLHSAGVTTFRRIIRSAASKLEIVVSFLAMLELVKQRRVVAHQAELFGEIEITPGEQWQADQAAEVELEFEE